MAGRATGLVGRAKECRLIERLLDDARGGQSRALIVHGEAGIGKTALMEHVVESATGFVVARATGVESEMELGFTGLHQICTPMLDQLERLPAPQRDAMTTALGLIDGTPPDRFLIGLALLNLLSNAAEDAPLLVVVDDAHWLDQASGHALAFAARRVFAERVCLLFGTRHVTAELSGLPALVVEGLANRDAAALLASVLPVPVDAQVRDRLIAETRGNPLALIEWPRGLPIGELAGGFGLPAVLPLPGQLEEGFRRRLDQLPLATQRFLTVAAADPTGDPTLVWTAAGHLALGPDDATPAIDAGLIDVGTTVRFRHPAVRSAVYAAAPAGGRREAHAALAKATDTEEAADRRAWHLALAAAGADEEVALQLEQSAGVAQARGGVSAAAALLERSAALTPDAAMRVQRTIGAAEAHIEAGAADAGERLLTAVEGGALDASSRARVESLRGYMASAWGPLDEAPRLYLKAAERLHNVDANMARDLHVGAIAAAVTVSDLTRGVGLEEAAKAARAAPPASGPQRPQDLLLDGLAAFTTDGPVAAAPILRATFAVFDRAHLEPSDLQWLGLQCAAASLLWEPQELEAGAQSYLQLARDIGALRTLPQALNVLAIAKIWVGDLSTAAMLVGEAESLIDAMGSNFPVYAAAQLAGLRGEVLAAQVIAKVEDYAHAQSTGIGEKVAQSARATLLNGMARHDEAFTAAQAADRPPAHWGSHLALHELVEAAERSGRRDVAADALTRISVSAHASGSDWALGIEARSRALLTDGEPAEGLYLEAIERLVRSPVRTEAARAHLLYGEWLFEHDRRADARRHLRTAHDQLTAIGMEAFADRAARGLAAAGDGVRTRTPATVPELTPQELQIARLVADGRTNQEIGNQLFLSARTIEWHLRKVFTKLDVRSRRGVRERMAQTG